MTKTEFEAINTTVSTDRGTRCATEKADGDVRGCQRGGAGEPGRPQDEDGSRTVPAVRAAGPPQRKRLQHVVQGPAQRQRDHQGVEAKRRLGRQGDGLAANVQDQHQQQDRVLRALHERPAQDARAAQRKGQGDQEQQEVIGNPLRAPTGTPVGAFCLPMPFINAQYVLPMTEFITNANGLTQGTKGSNGD